MCPFPTELDFTFNCPDNVTQWADSLVKGCAKLPKGHSGFYGSGSKRCVLSNKDLLSLQEPNSSSCSSSSGGGILTGTVIECCISLMLEECTLRKIAVIGSLNNTNPQRSHSVVADYERSLTAAKEDIGIGYGQPAFFMLVVNTNSKSVKPFVSEDISRCDLTGAVASKIKRVPAVSQPEQPPHWVLLVCDTGVPMWRSFDSMNGDHTRFASQQHRVLFGNLAPPPFQYEQIICPVQERHIHSGDFVVAFAMSAIKNLKLPAQAFSRTFGSLLRLYIAKTVLTNQLPGEQSTFNKHLPLWNPACSPKLSLTS